MFRNFFNIFLFNFFFKNVHRLLSETFYFPGWFDRHQFDLQERKLETNQKRLGIDSGLRTYV